MPCATSRKGGLSFGSWKAKEKSRSLENNSRKLIVLLASTRLPSFIRISSPRGKIVVSYYLPTDLVPSFDVHPTVGQSPQEGGEGESASIGDKAGFTCHFRDCVMYFFVYVLGNPMSNVQCFALFCCCVIVLGDAR